MVTAAVCGFSLTGNTVPVNDAGRRVRVPIGVWGFGLQLEG